MMGSVEARAGIWFNSISFELGITLVSLEGHHALLIEGEVNSSEVIPAFSSTSFMFTCWGYILIPITKQLLENSDLRHSMHALNMWYAPQKCMLWTIQLYSPT